MNAIILIAILIGVICVMLVLYGLTIDEDWRWKL